ncbi:hypothetical protein, partial [Pantoea agglomerans]|uniref:hypothetical protein n=1 Tax=Enterobacter agglomerans TaxID=549 RepID=UPI001A8DE64C
LRARCIAFHCSRELFNTGGGFLQSGGLLLCTGREFSIALGYSFTNSAFFYDGKTPVMPRVDLNSTAPDPWK